MNEALISHPRQGARRDAIIGTLGAISAARTSSILLTSVHAQEMLEI